ncbi:MAG: hypothetical protein EHM48_05260 [Planctomycetaceae bacterium]|nr:MAG: hypothetical protein EHM48_05260 [Planctomycetaceae bacterium]
MKKLITILFLGMFLCQPAMADSVYLRDGRKLEGKVTKSGDNVIIETSGGKETVSAADVIYIAPDAGDTPTSGSAGAVTPSVDGPTAVGVDQVTRPETMVFQFMRKLTTAIPGDESLALRKQLETWRAAVHDRKRKVGSNWLAPKDFISRRAAYDENNKELQDVIKKIKPAVAGTPRDMGPAWLKMRQTAMLWNDPVIRNFLMAITDYQSGNYQQSYTLFRQLHADEPAFAAFAQGEAVALCELGDGLKALTPAMEFIKMRPDAPEALALLRRAIQKTSGAEAKNPLFLAAKELSEKYGELPASTSTQNKMPNWLMPGKWTFKDETLPMPPVDRYTVRQAVAVAVTGDTLLVDSAALVDATEIMVRIDKNTVVPAVVRKLSTTTKTGPMPALTLLTVPGYVFAPATRDEFAELNDKDATISSLGIFEEMGSRIRQTSDTLQVADSQVKVSGKLLPGEGAAPILAEDQLAGFLAGKTDPAADDGGTDQLIPLAQINQMIRLAAKTSSGSGSTKLKRTGGPQTAEGKTFIVYAVSGEKFEDK